MKKLLLLITLVGSIIVTAYSQTTSINCESLNVITASWQKSKFAELKGVLVGTNTAMKITRFKLKAPMNGSLNSEVLIYTEAPDFNTVEIAMY